MSERFAKENIYNGEGVLLFAKGQELTEEVMQKLQKLHIAGRTGSDSLGDEMEIYECAKNIQEKFGRFSDILIKEASQTLSDVLFLSKSSPWWMSVNALSNYIDWLYTHSIDVALLSTILAAESGCDKTKQKEICLGALLHDIGKLLVPKKIMEKPDRLNEREMILMKQHCELGYGMIQDNHLPKNCADIILQHHERLDGSGYPYRLVENQISDEAKIVMIADVLDAVTSYRPYKSAWELSAGVKELSRAKTEFDSGYVAILADYLGDQPNRAEKKT